jgi:hypothetical protein
MYLASSYAPQARGGQAVSSAVTAPVLFGAQRPAAHRRARTPQNEKERQTGRCGWAGVYRSGRGGEKWAPFHGDAESTFSPESLEADGRRPSLTLGGCCSGAAALPAVGRERSARWRQVQHPRGCAHGPLHLALSRAALRRRGWGHTASVCTYAMYLASSYAPQARGGQAVSSAVTAPVLFGAQRPAAHRRARTPQDAGLRSP